MNGALLAKPSGVSASGLLSVTTLRGHLRSAGHGIALLRRRLLHHLGCSLVPLRGLVRLRCGLILRRGLVLRHRLIALRRHLILLTRRGHTWSGSGLHGLRHRLLHWLTVTRRRPLWWRRITDVRLWHLGIRRLRAVASRGPLRLRIRRA